MSAKTDKEEAIAVEVLHERERQDAKWGEPKDLPDGTGPGVRVLADFAWAGHRDRASHEVALMTADELASTAKIHCDQSAEQGVVTFADVLLDEVFEALAEVEQSKLRAELVQVSAVAQKWIGVIDGRAA